MGWGISAPAPLKLTEGLILARQLNFPGNFRSQPPPPVMHRHRFSLQPFSRSHSASRHVSSQKLRSISRFPAGNPPRDFGVRLSSLQDTAAPCIKTGRIAPQRPSSPPVPRPHLAGLACVKSRRLLKQSHTKVAFFLLAQTRMYSPQRLLGQHGQTVLYLDVHPHPVEVILAFHAGVLSNLQHVAPALGYVIDGSCRPGLPSFGHQLPSPAHCRDSAQRGDE